MHIAFCDAAGVVGFARNRSRVNLPKAPHGVFIFARGDAAKMEKIRAHLRLAYDGKTYLVPGVPEAKDQTAGVEAYRRFCDRLKRCNLL